jgi:hypothetical protein
VGLVMDIIDHGEWENYKPENYPIKLPSHIIFARRISDGADWYLFQRRQLTATSTIKMLLRKTDQGLAVITTTLDASELFPADSRLIEVSGVSERHESFRLNLVDLDAKRFTPPPSAQDRPDMMKVIFEELGLDEGKLRAKLDAAMKRRQHG